MMLREELRRRLLEDRRISVEECCDDPQGLAATEVQNGKGGTQRKDGIAEASPKQS